MKRSIHVEGWTVVLRVRTQRKKRKVNGRTRGRYEGKNAFVTVRAPGGETRTIYVGTSDRLGGGWLRSPARGEEKGTRAPTSAGDVAGGGKRGEKPLGSDLASVSPLYWKRRYYR